MPTVTSRDNAGRIAQTAQTEATFKPKQVITASTKDQPTIVDKLVESKTNPDQKTDQKGISVETPKAPEAAAPKAVTLSPQLTAIARKEAAVRKQEQALKAEREAIQAEKAEIAKIRELKAKIEAKDYSFLDEAGVKYEDWTNYLLAKGEEQKPETQEIKAIRAELEEVKNSQKQEIDKRWEATVGQYKAEIKKLVTSNPEFITIKEENAEEYVLKHILDTFEEDGDTLTIEDAAKEIEEALVERALKATNLTKVKAKSAPKEVTASEPEKKTLPPPQVRTLTNRAATEVPVSNTATAKQMQHLSPQQRLELAVKKATRTN